MLKISEIGKNNGSVTLKLEGRIIGPWVAELQQICDLVIGEQQKLKLDLRDVSFADANGVLLLESFRSRGVVLVDCSPFVEQQLKKQ